MLAATPVGTRIVIFFNARNDPLAREIWAIARRCAKAQARKVALASAPMAIRQNARNDEYPSVFRPAAGALGGGGGVGACDDELDALGMSGDVFLSFGFSFVSITAGAILI